MNRLAPRLSSGVEVGIGRYIANFALLEGCLHSIICELGKTSVPAGEILSSKLSFRHLVDCFGTLVREYVRNTGLHTEAEDLLRQIVSINEFRNKLVHSLWVPDDGGGGFAARQKLASSRKRGIDPQIERFKKGELITKCNEVAILTYRISDFFDKINIEQDAAPNKAPPHR